MCLTLQYVSFLSLYISYPYGVPSRVKAYLTVDIHLYILYSWAKKHHTQTMLDDRAIACEQRVELGIWSGVLVL